MPSPTTRYVTTSDGVSIAYMRMGEGPSLVFASNFRGDVHSYHTADANRRGFTDKLVGLGWEVVQHDTRGMGASDRDISDWSLDGRVKDLEAVVGLLDSRRFALVGVDQGAPAAITYAAKNPARVSHLVLVCPFANGAARYALPALRIAMSGARDAGPAWGVFTNVIGSVVTGFSDPPRGRQIADSIRDAMSAESLNAYSQASNAIDVTELLRHVASPTLVVHDPSFPFGSFDLCRDVATGIPNARLVVVQDRAMSGDPPNEMLPAIHSFLRLELESDDRGGKLSTQAAPLHASLTPRERDVLRLIAVGCSNKVIASALSIGERTVARHITNAYAKVGVHSKAAATAYAIRHGLT